MENRREEDGGNGETKWKREISAGGVVYKKDPPATQAGERAGNGKIYILLVNPKSRNFGPPEDYWTFPKGKQDGKDDLQATAIREVREEGGVAAEIEKELGYQKYFRNWKGDEAIKFVHYFLMKYISGDPADHDEEIVDAQWVDLDEVDGHLKFKTDKDVFEKAKKFLEK